MTTYHDFLKLGGYSANTSYNYKLYKRILEQKPLDQENINQFIMAHNTDMARAALRSYLTFKGATMSAADKYNFVLEGVQLNIPKFKGRRKKVIVKYWLKEDIIKFADTLDTQDSLLVVVLFESGKRISEALRIKKGDINFVQKQIFFGKTKSNKEQWGSITSVTADRLKEFCKDMKAEVSLFEGVNRGSWGRKIKTLSSRAYGRALTPHMLRHSCATHLKMLGWDLIEIMAYMGQESILTLEKYAHVTEQDNIKRDFDKIMG
jgi:integrase